MATSYRDYIPAEVQVSSSYAGRVSGGHWEGEAERKAWRQRLASCPWKQAVSPPSPGWAPVHMYDLPIRPGQHDCVHFEISHLWVEAFSQHGSVCPDPGQPNGLCKFTAGRRIRGAQGAAFTSRVARDQSLETHVRSVQRKWGNILGPPLTVWGSPRFPWPARGHPEGRCQVPSHRLHANCVCKQGAVFKSTPSALETLTL